MYMYMYTFHMYIPDVHIRQCLEDGARLANVARRAWRLKRRTRYSQSQRISSKSKRKTVQGLCTCSYVHACKSLSLYRLTADI